MRRLRQFHLWLGLFFAPAIFFFAFTGLLQVIGLHERQGGTRPAGWIVALANLHRHQTTARPERRGGMAPRPGPAGDAAGPRPGQAPTPFKPLAAFTAIALMLSTLLGVWVGLANVATRRTSALLLAIGTVVTVALGLLS